MIARIDPKEHELRVLFDVLGLSPVPTSSSSVTLNWRRVLQLAVANGVVAQFHNALLKIENLPVGAFEIVEDLHTRCRLKALRGLALRAELYRLLEAFGSEGLEVIPLKGPILADRYYRNPSFREFGDLDLLVHPPQRDAARKVLEKIGYHSPYQNKDLDKRYQIAFIHRESGEVVELHWRIAGPQYRPYSSGDFLWENVQVSHCAAQKVRIVSPEAELVYLAIHAYKHDWSRIQWIWDVYELLRATPGFDWDGFWRLARAMGVNRVVRATLQVTAATFAEGVGIPREVSSRPVMNRRQLSLVGRRMGDGDPDDTSVAEFFWLRVGMADTFRQRLRLIWSRMLPSDRDYELVKLPFLLRPLYVLIRPLRVAAKLFGWRDKGQ